MLYTLTKQDDADEVFNYTDTPADAIEKMFTKEVMHYRIKTIKSGNVLECKIYPVWNTRASATRLKKIRKSRDCQKALNHKNSVENLIRLVNTNFTDADIWGTQTYEPKRLPASIEDAQKEMQKYFRRLHHYAEKHDFPPLKYVYVTEFEEDEKKGKKRVHHHYVTNFPDRNIAEKIWRNGARTQTRRLQADESGYEGMVRYITKDPKGTKRYVTSKNLTKPTITIADTKISKKQVWEVATGKTSIATLVSKIYTNHDYTDGICKTSEFVSGAYIYAKLKRRKL